MKKLILTLSFVILFLIDSVTGQNIFSGEPIQVVGQMNSYSTAAASNSSYRRISVASGTPTDGRGQWVKMYNVQSSGGDFTPRTMSGGGGNGFLFISGPSSNRFQNKWVFSGTSVAALNAINNISAFNSGNDMGLNMSNAGRYTFVFNDCGYTATNAKFYIAYTQNAPVTITRNSVTVNPDRSATIAISSSDSLSPTENIYVRYSTGANFASTGTSAIVQASTTNSPTNTAWSATIPTTGSVNSTIRYYVFTSTLSLSALNSLIELEKSLAVINVDDSLGLNYQYSFPSTFASVQSGNFSDAATWGTAYVEGGNYIISNGHTVTVNANSSVNTIQINAGGTLVGDNGTSKTLSITNGGSFNNLGTYTSSSFSTVSFAGSGSITGNSTFGHVSMAGGVNFGTGSTINNSLTLQPGSFIQTNAPTYNTGSTLIYNSGGAYGRGTEWSSASGVGYPHHVQISGNTTLNLKGSSNTARFMGGNLTIDAGSGLSLQDLTITNPTVIGLTVAGNITNNGTVNLSTSTERIVTGSYTNSTGATTSLSSLSGGDLEITGNLLDNGTFNSNSRAVFFSGSSVQEVSGSGTFNIDYIVSNKSGGSIRMMSDLLCEGPNGGNAITLNSITDELDLNGFNLTLGKSGVTSGFTGSGSFIGDASSNLTILGNGSFGTLRFSSGSETINSITINRPSSGNINLGSDLNVLGSLSLTQGNLQVLSNYKLSYSGSSISRTGGTLQIGNSGNELIFENSSNLVLPASIFNGNIQTLRINSTGSVTIGSAITINNYLVLNGGNLIGSSSNSISLLNSSDTSLNRIGGYIEGSLIRRIPASSAGTISYLYPIGKVSYSPFELVNPITTSGGVVDIKAEAFETSTGGSAGTNMFSISSNRYWESSISSGGSNFTSTNIKLTEASIGSMNSIARSATLTGAYAKVSIASAVGNSIISSSLNSLGFLVFGDSISVFTSVQSGNFSDAATWGTAYFPGGSYIISNGHTVTVDANSSVSAIQINAGGTLVGDNGTSKTLSITNGGSFNNLGTYTSSSFSTVSFAGSGSITGTNVFGNVSIAGGVDFGTSSSINNNLTLQPGSFIQTNAPTYNTGSTLIYNTGGAYGRGLEWSAASGVGYPHHVQISGNTTLNLKGSSNTARFMGGNLTIDAGSGLSLQDLSITNPTVIGLTVAGNITNNGTVNLSTSTERIVTGSYTNSTGATTSLSSLSGGDLEITGNLLDNGTFNSNSRAVFFSGSSVQEVSGSGTFNIDYIVSNKSGGSIRMMSDLLCEGPNGGNAITLNSITDELDLNGFNLTLGKSGVTSGFTGSGSFIGDASSNLTILGNGSFGTLRFSSGSETINSITINRPSSGNINLGSDLNVLGSLSLTQGNLQVLSNYKLRYSGSSIIRTGGTLQIGNSGNELIFENSSNLVLPASIFNGNIQTLRINGTGSLTISSAISINNYLVLNGGNLIGSSSNSISLLNSSDTSLNRIGGYIEGSLIRRIPASSAGTISYLYPIGKVSYSPFELVNPITTSGGVVDIKAEVFETSTGGTAGTNMFSISSNRYWESSISSGGSNFTSTTIKLTEASIGSMNSIARSATLTGAYAKVSISSAVGNSIISSSLNSLGFLVFGDSISVFTSVQSGNFSDAATWGTAYFPGGSYIISSGHTVTVDANSSVSAIQINAGGTLVGDNGTAKTLSITNGGSFNNSGTYTSSSFSTVSFAGSGSITGANVFGNVSIAGGVDFGTSSSINNNLTLQPGSFIQTNAPTYNTGSTLIYNTGGTYGRSLEWNASSGVSYPHHVQISGNTTLNLKGGSNTARFMGGNLTIDAGSGLSLQDLTITNPTVIGLTVAGNITNNGTVNMGTSTERIVTGSYTNSTGATTSLSSLSGGDLEITGNLLDNGTFNSNSRAVFFSGSSVQEVSGSGTFDIDYIVSNKSGGSIRMMSDLLCEGPNGGNAITLNSITDELDLNGFNLTLGKSGVTSGFTGSGSFIGNASSNLTILGNGSFGTIRFSSGSEIIDTINLNRQSSGNVNLGSNLTILGNLNLAQGNFQVLTNNKLSYSGNSIIRTGGTLQIGNSGNELIFENSSNLVLPASIFNGNIQTLRINGTGSVTISSAIIINNYLVLNGGNLIGSSSNSISLLNSSDTSLNRIGGYIEGSLIRRIPASSAGTISYLYPIGKVSYSPFELVNPITTSGGVVDIKAEVFETSTGGSAGTNMFSISSNRYWESSISSGGSNFTSTTIKLTEASIGSMNSIARSATLTGAYDKANTNPASGSSITSNSLTSLGFLLFGNDSSSLSSSATLSLTAFFEGLYLGSSTMTSAPNNAEAADPALTGLTSATVADTILVQLHSSITYDSLFSWRGPISTLGVALASFPGSVNGNSYYIVIKHRNSLETWSANPVSFGSSSSYDFSTSSSQAYGDNMVDMGSGVYGIFTGDINQDGEVNSVDYTDLDPDQLSGVAFGYRLTDLNGDGEVNSVDYVQIDQNQLNSVYLLRP